MATYVFGDIHGEKEQLFNLLEKINYTISEDRLIFLGDYIDRGQDSFGTYKLIRMLELFNEKNVFLKGNHEQMMIDSVLNGEPDRLWAQNGGRTTLSDFDFDEEKLKGAAKWFNSIPSVYPTDDYVFVHAGIKPEKMLYQQDKDDFLWIRNEFLYAEAEMFKDKRTIISGHTPFDQVQFLDNRIVIDTGSGKGGHLSCLNLETQEVHSVA
jgi:serine/threonine protein phosphatase 1